MWVLRFKKLARNALTSWLQTTAHNINMMANRSPSLPIGVCERIIDFLCKDPESLHSCLLTCRAWVPRTIYHLYTSVRLSSPTGPAIFLQSLHSFLGNTQFVHCLSLGGCLHRSEPATQDDDELMVTAAIRLPRILTSLREIKIIRLPPDMHPTFPRLLSQFKLMTQLTLESTTFASFNEFQQLVLAFPNLKRLYLINSTWMVRRQPIPSPADHLSLTRTRRSRPALEHVRIYYDSAGDVKLADHINWLLTIATTSTLAELSVGLLNKESISAFNNLLSDCQDSLHTLEIYWMDHYKWRYSINNIDLRNKLTLCDLHIYDIDVTTFASLLLVVPPSLHTVSIRVSCDFRLEYTGNLDPAWKTVASALTSGHLQNVETIRIGVVDNYCGVVIFGHGLRALGLSKLDPRVVLTDYSEDDLQPYKPDAYTSIILWESILNQAFGSNHALATSQVVNDGVWTFIYTVSGKEYGRDTDTSLGMAAKQAACRTYGIWVEEICACPLDESRQRYTHLFK